MFFIISPIFIDIRRFHAADASFHISIIAAYFSPLFRYYADYFFFAIIFAAFDYYFSSADAAIFADTPTLLFIFTLSLLPLLLLLSDMLMPLRCHCHYFDITPPLLFRHYADAALISLRHY
jgi:hypothetical protein